MDASKTRLPLERATMMTAHEIGLAISFVVILFVIFSGALVGMLIGWSLPDHRVSGEMKAVLSCVDGPRLARVF
jgi:hypothetical protein